VAVNKAREHAAVPAGFLLGFMRKWRSPAGAAARSIAGVKPQRVLDPAEHELHRPIAAAPSGDREFHASDLRRLIGKAAYDARVLDVVRQFENPKFAAILAVHGQAVLAGEISRLQTAQPRVPTNSTNPANRSVTWISIGTERF
jgi:hypothetical protein